MPIGADEFPEGLRMGVEVFHALKKVLAKMGLSTAVGDEGGFAPMLPSNEAALDVVMEAIQAAGYEPGKDIAIALDVAASRALPGRRVRLQEGRRQPALRRGDGRALRRLGGPLSRSSRSRTAWRRTTGSGWALLTETLQRAGPAGGRRPLRHQRGPAGRRASSEGVANAILVKVNQIGTLTETLQCIELAKSSSYGVVISHRSGETEDTFIADLAVATGAGQIKTGSASRTDRVAKYNQLLRIAEELGDAGALPGPGSLLAVTPRVGSLWRPCSSRSIFALQGGEYSTRDLLSPARGRTPASTIRSPCSRSSRLAASGWPRAIERDPRVQERVARERVRDDPEGRVSLSAGAGYDGKVDLREAGSGKREAGSGKREAGSGPERASWGAGRGRRGPRTRSWACLILLRPRISIAPREAGMGRSAQCRSVAG